MHLIDFDIDSLSVLLTLYCCDKPFYRNKTYIIYPNYILMKNNIKVDPEIEAIWNKPMKQKYRY
jgi:hypothetical protein